ncbi:hypothetical protein KU74_06190 [Pectobacterium brasiliense]|uniref:Uncharacterized protein n=1 Tax=Pectobacterium brasiliense TaxID=180957 RepID=A0A0M2F6N5_9GAMM|nr:hypothetical protein [Pectobacterium brasiliense]KGA36060.1 hypothetical protein KU74_06190 [Pectobacterium brasiliense]
MTTFSKMDDFERFTKLKEVNSREMALAILGVNPFAKKKETSEDIEKEVSQLQTILRQNLAVNQGEHLQHNVRTESTKYFAESYSLIDLDVTPKPIIDKCNEVIANIAINHKNWKEELRKYGDNDLVEHWRAVRKNKRGIYRKEHEKENTDKLIALLIMLLSDKFGNKYGTVKNPSKREIYRDLVILAEKEGVSLKGIKESSFYNKVKESFNSLFS